MRIAAHSVVVEFRMLARPLLTCCSPQAIRTQGRSALVIAMMMNGTIRALQKLPNSGRPVIRMITASVSAPEADLTRTRTVGLMSRMPSLMRRNDAPQIRPSAANAAYVIGLRFESDMRRPIVGRQDERDGSVVLNSDLHDGSKASGLGFYSAFAKPLHEHLVELLCALRIACFEQARPAALAHVGEQRELRDDERRAADVDQAEVHPPRLVGENAQIDDLVREPLHRAVLVIRRRTHQQHETVADGCTPLFARLPPAHGAGGHALRDNSHPRPLIDFWPDVRFGVHQGVDVPEAVVAVLSKLGA